MSAVTYFISQMGVIQVLSVLARYVGPSMGMLQVWGVLQKICEARSCFCSPPWTQDPHRAPEHAYIPPNTTCRIWKNAHIQPMGNHHCPSILLWAGKVSAKFLLVYRSWSHNLSEKNPRTYRFWWNLEKPELSEKSGIGALKYQTMSETYFWG